MASKQRKRKKVTEPKRLYLNKPAEQALSRFMLRYHAPSASEAARTALLEFDEIYLALEKGATICALWPNDPTKTQVLLEPKV